MSLKDDIMSDVLISVIMIIDLGLLDTSHVILNVSYSIILPDVDVTKEIISGATDIIYVCIYIYIYIYIYISINVCVCFFVCMRVCFCIIHLIWVTKKHCKLLDVTIEG